MIIGARWPKTRELSATMGCSITFGSESVSVPSCPLYPPFPAKLQHTGMSIFARMPLSSCAVRALLSPVHLPKSLPTSRTLSRALDSVPKGMVNFAPSPVAFTTCPLT